MDKVKVAWYGKHFGEEPPLCGKKTQGAGTVFFSGCNMRCVFCQNYQISQQGLGKYYTVSELSDIFLSLQKQHCACIDIVTPTIWTNQIREALIISKEKGLSIPIVWNSNLYEDINIIKILFGLVDIFLPDFKYANDEIAFKYSGVKNYYEKAFSALLEMLSQAGNLKMENGLAKKGVIVRHLILPGNVENSLLVLDALAKINKNIFISLMCQYYPFYKATDFEGINRTLFPKEYEKVKQYLFDKGFNNGWTQELESSRVFCPDFSKINPFGR